jgi:hypothetical protein
MFTYRRLAAAIAAIGALAVGSAMASPAAALAPAAVTAEGGVHADAPGDVIRWPIYERNYFGLWANDRFSGSCPASHPYLTDKYFSRDRILPRGVIVTAPSTVATLVIATSSEDRFEGKKLFRAIKSIEGSWTNWDLGGGTVNVTLECTNDWKLARVESQYD